MEGTWSPELTSLRGGVREGGLDGVESGEGSPILRARGIVTKVLEHDESGSAVSRRPLLAARSAVASQGAASSWGSPRRDLGSRSCPRAESDCRSRQAAWLSKAARKGRGRKLAPSESEERKRREVGEPVAKPAPRAGPRRAPCRWKALRLSWLCSFTRAAAMAASAFEPARRERKRSQRRLDGDSSVRGLGLDHASRRTMPRASNEVPPK